MEGGVCGVDDAGFALVGVGAREGFQRNLCKEGDLEAFGFAFAAAVAKEVVFFTGVAFEPRHVFDESEDGNVDFGEHGDGFTGVDEGDFLGGGDNDGASEGDGLDDGELDVAGAWGEVEDEDVEFAPGDLFEELLGVAVGEGAADDDGGGIGEEEAHGHEFESVGFDGDDVFLVVGLEVVVGDAEHVGDGGAVEVAVAEADFESLLGEGDGEV